VGALLYPSLRAELDEIWVAAAASWGLALLLSVLIGFSAWRWAEAEHARRGAEAAKGGERRFHELAEMLPAMVVELDREGRATYANQYAFRCTGYSQQDLEGGLRPVEVLFPEEGHRVRDNVDRILAGEITGAHEYRLRRRDGTSLPVLAQSTPITQDGTVTGMRSVLFDLTERKALEARLREAEKLQAVGQLAGGVAHDFNNMLGIIIGYADLLQQKPTGDKELSDSLRSIWNAATSASDVVRQLLAFSRRQAMDVRIVDLNQVTANLAKMLRRVIGEHIELRLSLAGDPARVRADPSQVDQILMNLIANARDAMPSGGTVTVRTFHTPGSGSAGAPDAWVGLSVSDTGCGIDADTREHLFEPFFTTKATGRGTGLGLASVHGTVSQHGGRIEVESRRDQGSTFAVYLPSAGEIERETAPVREAIEPSLAKRLVLVVEDEEHFRHLAAAMLESLGCRTLVASGPREALSLASSSPEPIDLVLTDLVMPDMHGRELADQLRESRPGLPVVLISGYASDLLERYGLSTEGFVLLRKPFALAELETKLRQALARAQPAQADQEDAGVAVH
jgi:PAS domain S-box-containing protein